MLGDEDESFLVTYSLLTIVGMRETVIGCVEQFNVPKTGVGFSGDLDSTLRIRIPDEDNAFEVDTTAGIGCNPSFTSAAEII